MKQLLAYIRVSDPKQGKGVSLDEQRSIIEAYAARLGVTIIEWFVETRTAAKAGRPVFDHVVELVRAGKAAGFIVHKLDRTTRNWYDWAEINSLLDSGVDVHVASDGVELRSNGSRLAADMEILVAVHYIRNLRQEALKGIHGRLKQGIYPNNAPVGYLNSGAGKPKEIDPTRGPLVKRLFDLYATGRYSLRDLTVEAGRIGLRNRNGHSFSVQKIDDALRNPFYMGIMRSARYGLFPGKHAPLISVACFERVQKILSGRLIRQTRRFDFLFRRFIRCQTCGRSLSGSERKGHVYYRCPIATCPTTSLREDAIEAVVEDALRSTTLDATEAAALESELEAYFADETSVRAARRSALDDSLATATARLTRLTDLLLDAKIDAATHDERRTALILERQKATEELASLDTDAEAYRARVTKIFELMKSAEILYKSADVAQKRQLLEIVTSNCVANGKSLEFSMREPFATAVKRKTVDNGGQLYDTVRTFSAETLIVAASASSSLSTTLQFVNLDDLVWPTM